MRAASKKRQALIDEWQPRRAAFLAENQCMIPWCGRKATEVHEISRGPHRRAAYGTPAAWLALCRACHEQIHSEAEWRVARQLAVKAISDPERYDRTTVNRLRGRAPDAISEHDVLREVVLLLAKAHHCAAQQEWLTIASKARTPAADKSQVPAAPSE